MSSPLRLRALRLPNLLARLPQNGQGAKVYQQRWADKGLPVPSTSVPASFQQGCYWDVTKVDMSFREDGKPHAVVWGVGYWKGKRVTPEDKVEKIKGSLKYSWTAAQAPREEPYVKPVAAQAEAEA